MVGVKTVGVSVPDGESAGQPVALPGQRGELPQQHVAFPGQPGQPGQPVALQVQPVALQGQRYIAQPLKDRDIVAFRRRALPEALPEPMGRPTQHRAATRQGQRGSILKQMALEIEKLELEEEAQKAQKGTSLTPPTVTLDEKLTSNRTDDEELPQQPVALAEQPGQPVALPMPPQQVARMILLRLST